MKVHILSIGCDDVIECQNVKDQDILCFRTETYSQALTQLKTCRPDIVLFKDLGPSDSTFIELLHELGRFCKDNKNSRMTALLSSWDAERVKKLFQAGVGHFFVWPANKDILDSHLHRQIEQVKFAKFRAEQFAADQKIGTEAALPAPRTGSTALAISPEVQVSESRQLLTELRRLYFMGPLRAGEAQELFKYLDESLLTLEKMLLQQQAEPPQGPVGRTGESARILPFKKKVA